MQFKLLALVMVFCLITAQDADTTAPPTDSNFAFPNFSADSTTPETTDKPGQAEPVVQVLLERPQIFREPTYIIEEPHHYQQHPYYAPQPHLMRSAPHVAEVIEFETVSSGYGWDNYGNAIVEKPYAYLNDEFGTRTSEA